MGQSGADVRCRIEVVTLNQQDYAGGDDPVGDDPVEIAREDK